MRRLATIVAVFVFSAAPVVLWAQVQGQPATPAAEPAEHFYKLNFTLEEMNEAGKVENTRTYSEIVTTKRIPGDPFGQTIKTGSRVPVATGAGNGSTQIQYLDVGINLEVRNVEEVGDKLGFRLHAEVSSLGDESTGSAGGTAGDPVVRQNGWDSTVLIPIGKATVVCSSDDLSDKGKMQVQVLATRVE